jgi:hypothetical protein
VRAHAIRSNALEQQRSFLDLSLFLGARRVHGRVEPLHHPQRQGPVPRGTAPPVLLCVIYQQLGSRGNFIDSATVQTGSIVCHRQALIYWSVAGVACGRPRLRLCPCKAVPGGAGNKAIHPHTASRESQKVRQIGVDLGSEVEMIASRVISKQDQRFARLTVIL